MKLIFENGDIKIQNGSAIFQPHNSKINFNFLFTEKGLIHLRFSLILTPENTNKILRRFKL